MLALDGDGQSWVFEFQRHVADYESIARLLAYGSYVSQWKTKDFEKIYNSSGKRRNLERDFSDRFNVELPEPKPQSINLVLAALDFALPCREALRFLEVSANLVIGRLKIGCLWDEVEDPLIDYHWLKLPEPAKLLGMESDQRLPDRYFMLCEDQNEIPMDWEDCVQNKLLPIPTAWNLPQRPISIGAGIFVYLTGFACNSRG